MNAEDLEPADDPLIRRDKHGRYCSNILLSPGQRFGRLTVIEETRLPHRHRAAICICDCGNEITVRLAHLVPSSTRPSEHTQQSCGCLSREQHRTTARTTFYLHGLSYHPLYHTWQSMMDRCYNKKHKSYHNYGDRNIGVCPRWHDVRDFIEDIERILGPRPEGMTLDRKRNGLGYKPSNVRWADASTQGWNRQCVKLADSDRQEIRELHDTGQWTQQQLANKYGVGRTTIRRVVAQAA